MKIVTKYISDDGVEFTDRDKCLSHEEKVKTVIQVAAQTGNPVDDMICLLSAIRGILGLKIPSFEGYIELFSTRKPCSFQCSLWRFLADYSKDYPTVYKLFSDTLDRYIELYGEPAKHD